MGKKISLQLYAAKSLCKYQPDKKRETFALWAEFAVALVQCSAQVLAEGSGVT